MRWILAVLVLSFATAPAFAHEPSLLRNRAERSEDWFEWSLAHGERLYLEGRQLDAIEEFSVCALMRPSDIDSVARVAVGFVEFGSSAPLRLEKGGKYYTAAKSLIREGVARGGKGDPRLGYAIGRLYFVDGDWIHAHEMFKEALARLEAGDREYLVLGVARVKSYYFRSAVNVAPTIIDAGRAQEVVDELGALLEEDPDGPFSPAARINLALARRRLMDTVEAEGILRELTESHPEYGEAWNAFGQVLQDQGRNEEALEAYQQSIALASARGRPHSDSLASMAEVLLRLDRNEAAAEAVNSFMSTKPDSPHGFYLLAKIRRAQGDTKEAILLLRRAKRLEPTLWKAYTDLVNLHYSRGEVDEAAAVKAENEAVSARLRKKLDDAKRAASGDGPDGGDVEPGGEPDGEPGGEPDEEPNPEPNGDSEKPRDAPEPPDDDDSLGAR